AHSRAPRRWASRVPAVWVIHRPPRRARVASDSDLRSLHHLYAANAGWALIHSCAPRHQILECVLLKKRAAGIVDWIEAQIRHRQLAGGIGTFSEVLVEVAEYTEQSALEEFDRRRRFLGREDC